MLSHPFMSSSKRTVLFSGICIFLSLSQCLLFFYYGSISPAPAIVDSILSVLLLMAFCGGLWYIMKFIYSIQTKILMSFAVLLVWLAGCFIIYAIVNYLFANFKYSYATTLPIRMFLGTATWIITIEWFHILELQSWKNERMALEQEQSISTIGMTGRIAVKDGQRIHVISNDEIIYLQAAGDYVSIVTTSGEYLKEQTMKYFESHLPPDRFTRIHRSYIVNVDTILRVELFGKENYAVLLKNGNKIKASISGYKLLKEKLNL